MAALLMNGVAVASLLCGCGSPAASRPLPPASATPAQVARAYVDAAKRGDCATTRKLTTSHTWSWCSDPRLVDYRSLGRTELVPASEAGVDEQMVLFQVKTTGSSDGSMPAGRWEPWGLAFVRTPPGWRLYDQGQG